MMTEQKYTGPERRKFPRVRNHVEVFYDILTTAVEEELARQKD